MFALQTTSFKSTYSCTFWGSESGEWLVRRTIDVRTKRGNLKEELIGLVMASSGQGANSLVDIKLEYLDIITTVSSSCKY